jgi:uncharacterized membrane protein YphA (DoxX/SURF4 family)
MNIVAYVIRFLVAFIFIYAGIEKLFLPYNPSVFRADASEAHESFFTFYELLQGAGYLYFVGFFQLLCGLLLVFKRTWLLGSIMLVPLMLCLLMTHLFSSKYVLFIAFDALLFLMVLFLLSRKRKPLKNIFFAEERGIF